MSSAKQVSYSNDSSSNLLHFNNVFSVCFLLLSLVSSAYIAFGVGHITRLVFLLEKVSTHKSLVQPTELKIMAGERVTSAGVELEVDEARLPSGQHLSVDIQQHVHSNFLGSERERELADAMVSLVNESDSLTLLSYHCHTSADKTCCVAVLLDGQLSVHTWPSGVVILDLFTQSNRVDLIPMLPLIEHLFANSTAIGSATKPKLHWGHKLRGFRTGFYNYRPDKNPHDQELGVDILRRRDFDYKKPMVSAKTRYQHVDIYELLHQRGTVYSALGEKSPIRSELTLSEDDESKPDRALFIDGILQSSLYGEAVYHETLVHPALFSHPDPRRVAIIGGGEGATLRECLKHNTVKEVVMIEIDEELTNVSRMYLPEWSDCSDILDWSEEEVASCFDNPRATLYFEDAFGFFLEEFGGNGDDDDAMADTNDDTDDEELFDVIIMDALDPDDFGDFVDKLYNDTDFIRSLYDGLTESGVFAVQVGAIPQYVAPPDELSSFYNRAAMLNKLEEVGFQSIHIYDEGHCHFYEPWEFIVAFKDSRASWYKNAAEFELLLHQRLHKTKSGKPPLSYFDGSSRMAYQIPPKVIKTNHCRKEDTSLLEECNEYPGLLNFNSSVPRSVDRKKIGGDYCGRGLDAAFAAHESINRNLSPHSDILCAIATSLQMDSIKFAHEL